MQVKRPYEDEFTWMFYDRPGEVVASCPVCGCVWFDARDGLYVEPPTQLCPHLRFTLLLCHHQLRRGECPQHHLVVHGKWDSASLETAIRNAFARSTKNVDKKLRSIVCPSVHEVVIHTKHVLDGCFGNCVVGSFDHMFGYNNADDAAAPQATLT